MNIDTAALIYFSPTGTTKKIVHAISEGMKIENPNILDLTLVKNRSKAIDAIKGDIAILGVPVYEEQVPKVIKEYLSNLKGNGQPTVVVAVYGNIGYGITLKEMSTIAEKAGFKVIGGAAFIGEHSFSNSDVSLAKARPDSKDIEKAISFGDKIRNKLENISDLKVKENIILQGNLPLIAKVLPEGSAKFFSKDPNPDMSKCNSCGACVKICPAEAVNKDTLLIDTKLCLRCFACVRKCPKNARRIEFKNKWIVSKVLKFKGGKRKEPEIFLCR